ncbi:hypothetical protein NT6N_33500 [Oceaniferula spumae]|uniref:Protein kinase domain-containing protein n=1 Tax=Oceaniferula spumae TaxID=2979115 RepID=A0AAT9FQL7_9BACT
MIDSQSICPDCGIELPSDSPQHLCPSCLLKQAFVSHTVESKYSPISPPPSPEEIADKFPQFEITECLGRGGMGVVYKARQKSLNRWVAIKVLAPERVDDEKFAERFAREAQTLAQLNHSNIVTVHDYGETDGLYYIVMEFVDGVNVRDLLRDGKIEPTQALSIVPPICEALQYAHDKGIVHRDIKPENLLIDRDGRVKIADFGIASIIGTCSEVSGTPPYMAPEQGTHAKVDHRADIYALGVVLYEMLTGERPNRDFTTPFQKCGTDVRIDEMVNRALEREPDRRYQSATEFRTVVETIAAPAISPPPNVSQPKRGMFRRFWWMFLVMIPVGVLFGIGAGSIYAYVTPKKYESNTIIEIKRPPGDFTSSVSLSTSIAALSARETLSDVSSSLDLEQRWKLNEDQVINRLESMIVASQRRGTDLIELKVRGSNRVDNMEIANRIPMIMQARMSELPDGKMEFVVHEEATIPENPFSPNIPLILTTAAVLGFTLSPLAALVTIPLQNRIFPDRKK